LEEKKNKETAYKPNTSNGQGKVTEAERKTIDALRKAADVPAPAENASALPDEITAISAIEYEFGGRHLVASYFNCNPDSLRDFSKLDTAMHEAIEASGATVVSASRHVFPGGGLTGLYLLAESHASLHTYPEHDSCFVDIFTCGFECEPIRFHEVLVKYFQPQRISHRVIVRGESNAYSEYDDSH
jgi:S-adenosylmethionine decarboxylase